MTINSLILVSSISLHATILEEKKLDALYAPINLISLRNPAIIKMCDSCACGKRQSQDKTKTEVLLSHVKNDLLHCSFLLHYFF